MMVVKCKSIIIANTLMAMSEVVKFFITGIVFSHAKLKAILQMTIIWITVILTIFTVSITHNHKPYAFAVDLNYKSM